MSIQCMTFVWQASKEQGSALLLLLALADYANDDGECWPGVSALADKCRMTVRNTQLILRRMEGDKTITVIAHDGTNTSGGKTNRYIINGFGEWNKAVQKISPRSAKVVKSGANVVKSSAEGGEISGKKVVKLDSPDPSLEPPTDPSIDPPDSSAPVLQPVAVDAIPVIQIEPTNTASVINPAINTAPKVTPSEPDPEPPPKVPAKGSPAAPARPKITTELKNAFAMLCHGTETAWNSDKLAKAMMAPLRELLALEPMLTPERIAAFSAEWKKYDFRGQKGQKPEPYQIPQQWPKLMIAPKGHDHDKPATTSTEPRNFGAPKLREPPPGYYEKYPWLKPGSGVAPPPRGNPAADRRSSDKPTDPDKPTKLPDV